MTKRELIKLIPNHGKFAINAPSKQFPSRLVLLHSAQRDGQTIWVDVEFDDGFGRWLCPFADLTSEEREYVYESVEFTLKSNER